MPKTQTAAPSLEEPRGRPIPEHPDALLHTVEVAFLQNESVRTLEGRRRRGDGIPYIQISPRAVRYRRRDINAYNDARRRKSTSDPLPPDPETAS